MALLNPPELRVSLMVIIAGYLAVCRGQRETQDRLVDALAPATLSKDGKHQNDLTVNLRCARELGLVTIDDEGVHLAPTARKPANESVEATVGYIRRLVLAPEMNTAAWRSQQGARDLTNALAWFLQFPASAAPTNWEGHERSAFALQTADFGRRNDVSDDADDEVGVGGGWPIINDTRWNPFRRWACSLGFCWQSPSGDLIPDPTPAVRAVLADVFDGETVMDGPAFVRSLGKHLPVLETGDYRAFVEANWTRPRESHARLSAATTDALRRLQREGRIALDDRADADRVTLFDGETVSHVRAAG